MPKKFNFVEATMRKKFKRYKFKVGDIICRDGFDGNKEYYLITKRYKSMFFDTQRHMYDLYCLNTGETDHDSSMYIDENFERHS